MVGLHGAKTLALASRMRRKKVSDNSQDSCCLSVRSFLVDSSVQPSPPWAELSLSVPLCSLLDVSISPVFFFVLHSVQHSYAQRLPFLLICRQIGPGWHSVCLSLLDLGLGSCSLISIYLRYGTSYADKVRRNPYFIY